MTYCLAMIHSWVKYQHKDKIKQYNRTLDNDDVCNATKNEWILMQQWVGKIKEIIFEPVI